MSRPRALLLAAHGIRGGPGVGAEHARALAAELPGLALAVGCIKGEPMVEAALAGLPRPVRVVPLLMAEGFILELLRRRLEGRPEVELTPPIGTCPELAGLVLETALATARGHGFPPEASLLLLVGHGTPRHPGSARATAALVDALRARGGFAAVEPAFLEEPPLVQEVVAAEAHRPVVAVGLFLDEGPHGRDDVLAALAAAPGPVAYAGPVGAQAGIRALVKARAGLG